MVVRQIPLTPTKQLPKLSPVLTKIFSAMNLIFCRFEFMFRSKCLLFILGYMLTLLLLRLWPFMKDNYPVSRVLLPFLFMHIWVFFCSITPTKRTFFFFYVMNFIRYRYRDRLYMSGQGQIMTRTEIYNNK